MEPQAEAQNTKVILTRSSRIEVMDYSTEEVTLKIEFDKHASSKIQSGISPCGKLFWAHDDSKLVVLSLAKGLPVLERTYEETIDAFYFLDKAHFAVNLRENKDKTRVEVVNGPKDKTVFKAFVEMGLRRKEFLRADLSESNVYLQESEGVVAKYKLDVDSGELKDRVELCKELMVSKLYLHGQFFFVLCDSIRDVQNKGISRVHVFDTISGEKLVTKDFKGVQELNLKASEKGDFALLMASKYVDRQNEFYYGKDSMWCFVGKTHKILPVETYLGNIHDWTIIGKRRLAMIISGKMPAKVVLYDFKGNPKFLMEHNFRNTISVSPNFTLLAIGGFGQLSGEVKVFSLTKNHLVGRCMTSYASWLKWAPDGVRFMTATVQSKLNENHQFAVYDYKGNLLKKIKIPENDLQSVDFFFWCKFKKKIDLKELKLDSKNSGLLLQSKLENSRKIGSADIRNSNFEQQGGTTGAQIGSTTVFNAPKKPSSGGVTFGAPKLTRKGFGKKKN